MHNIENIFSGCAETGKISKTKLQPQRIKAALREAHCYDFFPSCNNRYHHEVYGKSLHGWRDVHYMPTLQQLLIDKFWSPHHPSVGFMRRGFNLVAEAIHLQSNEPQRVNDVRAILKAAGSAIAVSFQILSEGSRRSISNGIEGPSTICNMPVHQFPNFLRRPEGEKIAQRLFDEGVKFN